MARKRFSRHGREIIEKNSDIVELLLKSTETKIKRVETELKDLESHRRNIASVLVSNKDFHTQRINICDRDINNLKKQLASAREEYYDMAVWFKRYYYLLYGRPKLSDLKVTEDETQF
jgi:hypothetical protein